MRLGLCDERSYICGMSYTRADVKAVRNAISAEFPDAYFEASNYGYDLGVRHPTKEEATWLFRHVKDEDGVWQEQCRCTLDRVPEVLEWMRS